MTKQDDADWLHGRAQTDWGFPWRPWRDIHLLFDATEKKEGYSVLASSFNVTLVCFVVALIPAAS